MRQLGGEMRSEAPASVNAPTIDQLAIACRHVDELRKAGCTENAAIRILELLADVYAKLKCGGSATPHHVDQVDRRQWSTAAKEAQRENPNAKAGALFRVEHGTPRRAFARLVLKLFHRGDVTAETMNALVDSHWKLAVITLDEDRRLNRNGRRSRLDATPDERWREAGIRFDRDDPCELTVPNSSARTNSATAPPA
jgi:hypothetical protein